MVWSHNESWMITGDHAGYVKYWQSNMNNVKMFKAHINAIRGLRYIIHHTSPYVYRATVETLDAVFIMIIIIMIIIIMYKNPCNAELSTLLINRDPRKSNRAYRVLVWVHRWTVYNWIKTKK